MVPNTHATPFRRLASAASLVHTLPGAGAVLRWPDGTQRSVGRHPSCDVSACAWRDAVVQSALTASLLPHELLVGLPGAPAVELVPGPHQSEVGGGVVRWRDDGQVIDLFATTLTPPEVRDVAEACSAPGWARIGGHRDELTGTTLVAVAHVEPPEADSAELAWSLSLACGIREVSRLP